MANLPPPNNDPNVPEEEPIPEQAPAALVGFAPQWIGGQIPNNNNGWLEEDDEEDPEEDDDEDPEEDDDEEPEEDEVGDGEEEEMEIDDEMDNPEVIDPDEPPPPVFYRTTKLEKQMFERYNIEIKIKKKFNEDELCMNRHELDVTIKYSKMKRMVEGLSKQIDELKLQCSRAKRLSQWEAWVRPCIPERLRFQEEPPTPSAFAPRADDPYVMARDAAMAA
ncbi:hypothetical protein Tco_1410083 [Tanacetum coccineum]